MGAYSVYQNPNGAPDMTNTFQTTAGNYTVVTAYNAEMGSFHSTLWVNARHGMGSADITTFRATHYTEAGARRWAKNQLARCA
jgi:hypothetical protein